MVIEASEIAASCSSRLMVCSNFRKNALCLNVSSLQGLMEEKSLIFVFSFGVALVVFVVGLLVVN